LKKKPNWIDFGILGLVLILAFLMFMKFKSTEEIVENSVTSPKQVLLKIEGVREYSVDAIKAGDSVYSTDMKEYFGKIKDVEVEEAYEFIVKDDGEVVEARVPEKYDITLMVDCNILERETGYYAEGVTEVKVNSAGTYRTENIQFSAKTIGIKDGTGEQ
jgi:hypothetical protein